MSEPLRTRNIELSGFSASAGHDEERSRIIVTVTGSADSRAGTALSGFLLGVHSDAQRLKITDAVFDMTELEFLSSSGFKALVNWFMAVQNDRGGGYPIRLRTAKSNPTQARGLKPLSCFEVEFTIEEV